MAAGRDSKEGGTDSKEGRSTRGPTAPPGVGDPEGKLPLNGVYGASTGFGKAVLQEWEGYFVLKELMFHIEALFLYNIQSLMHF